MVNKPHALIIEGMETLLELKDRLSFAVKQIDRAYAKLREAALLIRQAEAEKAAGEVLPVEAIEATPPPPAAGDTQFGLYQVRDLDTDTESYVRCDQAEYQRLTQLTFRQAARAGQPRYSVCLFGSEGTRAHVKRLAHQLRVKPAAFETLLNNSTL